MCHDSCVPANGLKINGEALRAIRELLGYSGTDFAAEVGIDRAYYAHIEAGRRNPSPAVFQRIVKAIKRPPAAILADPEQAA